MSFLVSTAKPVQLLKALAESSKLMLENKMPNTIINKVLSLVGKAADVDRVCIFKNIYNNGKLTELHYEYEWCNTEIEAQIKNETLNTLNWNTLGNLKDTLPYGINYTALTKNITNPFYKQTLEEKGVKSTILMPIFTDFIFWGYIGFEDCSNERIWEESEHITITSIASNIGIFIQRNELEKKLTLKQEQVTEQNTFFNNIFNNLPADVVIFSPEHKYLFVNKQGIADDETRKWIIGKDDFEYCAYRNKPMAIAEARQKLFDKVKNSMKPISIEEEFKLPNGEKKYHLRYMVPVLDADKNFEFMLGYGIDITELRQKENIITKQHFALENSPVGIALLGQNGQYYYMNKSHAKIFDYDQSEMIGKSWKTLYSEEESTKIENEYFPILLKEGKWIGETEGLTKNGEKITQEIALSLFSDGDIVCVTKDMTKTKEELNKVQKINAQLELAMKASNLGMWTFEIANGKVEINEASYDMLKLSKDEFNNITLNKWMDRIHPEDRNEVLKAVNNHIENYINYPEDIYRKEYRIKQKDGAYIWVLGVGKISKTDNNGIPQEMTGFTLDINTQKLFDEKVKQSDKRYRDLVESLKEIIFRTDTEGNLNFLNNSWETITGFKINESINERLIKYIHSEDKVKVIRTFKDLIAEKIDYKNDIIKFIDANNSEIWLDFHVSLHKDINGKKLGIVGSAENITARIEAETELEKNKEILNKVVNSIDDVIWSYDILKDELSYISPSCKNMTGVSDSDFYSKKVDWYDLVSTSHSNILKESDLELITNKNEERDIVYKMEVGNPTQIKWVRDKAKLCYNETGEPIRIDGITFDITSVILAEENLKLSEEKYRLISENIQDIVTILDIDGNIQYMSPSAIKLSGYTELDFINYNLFKIVHPDSQKEVELFLNQIKPQVNNQIIFKIIKANGEELWVESIVTILGEKEGKTILQASTRDITPRIMAELELKKALEKEKELSMLKSRFVSMASHEFRTPLATIRTGTELIKLFIDKEDGALSPKIYGKVNEKISEILLDIDRISDLMTDILTLGKVEASKISFNPKSLCINDFIKEYVAVDAVKIVNKRKVQLTLPKENIWANIDTKLITQVLQNGIGNAIKYSEEGKPIDINISQYDNKAIISIKDYGIGIPENELPLVFESFFRSTNADNIPGTGLGMAIIKLFVEMHGGEVSIESTINIGTILTITLPIGQQTTTLDE